MISGVTEGYCTLGRYVSDLGCDDPDVSENDPADGPPLTLAMALALEISSELGRQRMSDQELGRRIGVAKNTAGRLMNGKAPIDMRRLFKIAEALGVPPEEFIRRARIALSGGDPMGSNGNGFNPLRGGPPPR